MDIEIPAATPTKIEREAKPNITKVNTKISVQHEFHRFSRIGLVATLVLVLSGTSSVGVAVVLDDISSSNEERAFRWNCEAGEELLVEEGDIVVRSPFFLCFGGCFIVKEHDVVITFTRQSDWWTLIF